MKKNREKKSAFAEALTNIHFGVLAEVCPAGIFISDKAGICHFVNNAWCTITGLEENEAKNTVWLDLVHPDDKELIQGGWEDLIRDKTQIINEFRLIDRNGNTKWLTGIVKFPEGFKIPDMGIIGIHFDISEIKKNLSETEKYRIAYKNLVENSLDAILLTSPDGKIFSANPAACRMFERSEQELCKLGRDCVVDHTDPRLAVAIRNREINGNFFGELRLVRKSGKKFRAEISSSIFSGNDGNLYTCMIIRDVTKLRQKSGHNSHIRKTVMTQYLEYQKAIERERSQIALDLHDDLGQRFSSLKLNLAWIKNRIGVQAPTVGAKFEELNSLIDESVAKIRDFISILKPSVLFELGLTESLKWQLDRFENQTQIRCNFFCHPEEIHLDEEQSLALFRILQEALTNVKKHADATNVTVEIRLLKKSVVMIIKDNGKGFDTEKINLFMCKGISGMKERVKYLGGKITINSIINKGTTIKVSLPKRQD